MIHLFSAQLMEHMLKRIGLLQNDLNDFYVAEGRTLQTNQLFHSARTEKAEKAPPFSYIIKVVKTTFVHFFNNISIWIKVVEKF